MKQILLVDDSHFFTRSISEFLSRSGNSMITAKCCGEALKILKKETPHLILMDYYLEDMKGDECCRMIKSGPATKDVPVIMIISVGNTDDAESSRNAGCDDYIAKPVDRMELLTKVRKFVHMPTREKKRVPICVPALYYHDSLKRKGMIFCISESGMYIQGENMPENGSIIQASFSISGIAGDIEVKAEVTWNTLERGRISSKTGPGFGVRFLSVDQKGIEAIKTYVDLGNYIV